VNARTFGAQSFHDTPKVPAPRPTGQPLSVTYDRWDPKTSKFRTYRADFNTETGIYDTNIQEVIS
jgi:hypothetical protein